MSTLTITEFAKQGTDSLNRITPVAHLPSLGSQAVTISGASAQSAALNAETSLVRLLSDVNCCIKVSTNPTAATTDLKLIADSPEYFTVDSNRAYKIAVIGA